MKFYKLIAAMLVPVLSFSGCASIVGQSVFPLTINSNPSGSNITITDEYGKLMFNGTTPTTITLAAGESYMHAKVYTIKYSKPGYADQVSVVKADIDGWFFGNILFGGIIGMLIIDPITGKMWKLPPQTYGNLSPSTSDKTSMNNKNRVLQIASIDQVPQEMRKHLISLN